MPCSICKLNGPNIRTCTALREAEVDVQAKRKELEIAEEKRDHLQSLHAKVEKTEKKDKTKQKDTRPTENKLPVTDSETRENDIESEDGISWEIPFPSPFERPW